MIGEDSNLLGSLTHWCVAKDRQLCKERAVGNCSQMAGRRLFSGESTGSIW